MTTPMYEFADTCPVCGKTPCVLLWPREPRTTSAARSGKASDSPRSRAVPTTAAGRRPT